MICIYIYLGVGPKPVAVQDTKTKGKNGGKGGPQPGDVGFFKLGLLNTPQNHNDGTKVISVKYDYCSFNSGRFCVYQILFYQIFFTDWAAKKELFIAMMLRAYSQEVFNPQSVFEEEDSEIGFTNRIEGFMKDFIINQLAGDTNAIRKEVERLIIKCTYLYIYIFQAMSMYNVIKDNMKKKSIKKLAKNAMRMKGMDRK